VWLDGTEIDRAGPAFASGWHAAEPHWRWTDGDATLVVAGAQRLAFEVAVTGRYWTATTRLPSPPGSRKTAARFNR
jgi:hypothetical protein